MEQLSIAELANRLSPVFSDYDIKKAVLFGSVAKGTATDKSDVDIMVDSGLKGMRFVGLLEDVQNAVGKDVDMLDVSHIDHGSLIEREIADTGVTIYSK